MPFECPQNEAADPWDGKINGCVAVISICLSGISLGTSLIFLIRGSYTWWFSLEGSHYPYIGMILLSVFLLSLVAFSVWTNLSIHRRDNSKAIKVLLWLTFDFGRFATVLWTAALANHMGNLCQAVCLESFRYKSSFASDCKRILTVLLVLLVVEAIYLEVIEAYLATSDILPNLSDFPFAIMGGGILAWVFYRIAQSESMLKQRSEQAPETPEFVSVRRLFRELIFFEMMTVVMWAPVMALLITSIIDLFANKSGKNRTLNHVVNTIKDVIRLSMASRGLVDITVLWFTTGKLGQQSSRPVASSIERRNGGTLEHAFEEGYMVEPSLLQIIPQVIAGGGSGNVYRATYQTKAVAVKVLHNQALGWGSDEGVGEFEHEVEMLRRIQHPHVVQFVGIAPDPQRGWLYIITEWVPFSLTDIVLEKSGFSYGFWDFCRLASQLMETIRFLHAKKVVHRDIKPANLLIDDNWNLKLCDFGIAQVEDVPGSAALNETSFGTPLYMPPECHRPSNSAVNGRQWDIFSSGIVFWWMLERRPAFGANEEDVSRRYLNGERPAFSDETPVYLQPLLSRMWHDDSQERPDPTEVLAVLNSFQKTLPERGTSASSSNLSSSRPQSFKKFSSFMRNSFMGGNANGTGFRSRSREDGSGITEALLSGSSDGDGDGSGWSSGSGISSRQRQSQSQSEEHSDLELNRPSAAAAGDGPALTQEGYA